MEISVIVPVYNGEQYISRCIESIIKQTFVDFELILVNDGSQDNSLYICKEYEKKDKRITIINKENGGLSSARNAGIEVSKGTYLFFVDADDVIHSETLSILYANLKSSDSDISIGNFCKFYSDSELIFSSIENNNGSIYSGEQALLKLFEKKYIVSHVSVCGKLIKRSLFQNIRFPIGKLFEDEFTTYLLYYKAKRIIYTEESFYFYFVNNDGITRNLTLQKYFDEYEAQWQRINFFKEKGLTEVYHKALLNYLSSGQWSLIECREKKERFDENRGKLFENQYQMVLKMAHRERILDFLKHYDYYVLGNPKYILYYRVKRKILQVFKIKLLANFHNIDNK